MELISKSQRFRRSRLTQRKSIIDPEVALCLVGGIRDLIP